MSGGRHDSTEKLGAAACDRQIELRGLAAADAGGSPEVCPLPLDLKGDSHWLALEIQTISSLVTKQLLSSENDQCSETKQYKTAGYLTCWQARDIGVNQRSRLSTPRCLSMVPHP